MHQTSKWTSLLTCPHFTCQQEMKLHYNCRFDQGQTHSWGCSCVYFLLFFCRCDANVLIRPSALTTCWQCWCLINIKQPLKLQSDLWSFSTVAAQQLLTVLSPSGNWIGLPSPITNMLLVSERNRYWLLSLVFITHNPPEPAISLCSKLNMWTLKLKNKQKEIVNNHHN